MNSTELMALLRAKFSEPDWALVEEVRDSTGYAKQGKRMDAMALGLWPSRGMEVLGFELKVSRSDLARELLNPEKADDFYSYVDRWYLVLSDKNLLKPGELPPTWGLIAPRGDTLAIITEAPKHKTKPLDRLFIAAIVRRLRASYILKNDLNELVKKTASERIDEAVRGVTYERDRAGERVKELQETIGGFQKASGVNINEWNHGDIGAAVQIVLRHGPKKILQDFDWMIQRTATLLEQMQAARAGAVDALDKIDETEGAVTV